MLSSLFPGVVTIGTIIGNVSGARWYQVRFGEKNQIPCAALSGLSSTDGPMELGVYNVGERVLVFLPYIKNDKGVVSPRMGYIIGAIPAVITPALAEVRKCDSLSLFSGAGAVDDVVHSDIAKFYPDEFRDFNIGQPLDAIPGSDQGVLNKYGVGYGMSNFYAWLKASEMAGVSCFVQDNLLRLAGYNLEEFTAGSERHFKNDEGEITDIEVLTPYPWEGLGASRRFVDVFNEYMDESDPETCGGIWVPGQTKMAVEPAHTDQTPFPRLITMRGYLGDVWRMMVVRPCNPDVSIINRMSDDRVYTGLLDLHAGMDGGFSIRSARGISLVKTIHIPVPRKVRHPEESDTLGDGVASGYKPAGVWTDSGASASVDSKYIKYDFDLPLVSPHLILPELWDYHAYMFNWYGYKAFQNHANDWIVPEAAAVFGDVASVDEVTILSAPLSTSFSYSLPDLVSMTVDHRNPDGTKYYKSKSTIQQLPDGSIILEDGYGSSITMAGGNIFLTAPGDIWSNPGRGFIVWAGDDAIIRAGSSCDVTASNGDIRLKSEHNMHMLAGNCGVDGGILLESRSVYGYGGLFKFRDSVTPLLGEDVKTYGIILKCANEYGSPTSPIQIYGSDIFIKADVVTTGETGSEVPGVTDHSNGTIIFDAAANIINTATDVITFAGTGITDVLGQTLNDTSGMPAELPHDLRVGTFAPAVFRFTQNSAIFGFNDDSSLRETVFRSNAKFALFDCYDPSGDGQFETRGRIATARGVVHAPDAVIASDITSKSTSYATYLSADEGTEGGICWLLHSQNRLTYAHYHKGDPDFIAQAGFTCRSEEQYGYPYTSTGDFILGESRWQQMFRDKDIGIVWNEPVVETPRTTTETVAEDYIHTAPHPGNKAWNTSDKFGKYDSELWSWTFYRAINRDEHPYEEDTIGDLKLVGLAENYKISTQIVPAT